jgi:hypothetical protein
MSVYSIASDVETRQTVWVARKVKTDEQIKSAGEPVTITAAELSYLATSYEGWQGPGHQYWCNPEAKRLSFPA